MMTVISMGGLAVLYFFMCRLTEEGQQRMLRDPEQFNAVCREIHVEDTQLLARYAVLGRYDYVVMVEAGTHEDAARLSLELGARARVHIETMPTVAVTLLADGPDDDLSEIIESRSLAMPTLNPLPPDDAPPSRT